MPLSLSLDCSFLDLSNDDSGYDSPSSSFDDEPLDSQVLPLPSRRTTRSTRCNLYHNESSINSKRGWSGQRFTATSSLALSDILWPLPNYEAWLNPAPFGLITPRSRKTQPYLTTLSASPLATFVAQSKSGPNDSSKRLHSTASDSSTLAAAFENEISLRKNKIMASSVPRRQKHEPLRDTASNSNNLLPIPPCVKTNPLLHALPVTHCAPFVTRTDVNTCSNPGKIAQSVNDGAASKRLLSPLSFPEKLDLEMHSECGKPIPKVSIIPYVSRLNQEENKTSSNPFVKIQYSLNGEPEIDLDRLNRKKSTLKVNRPRTRTSSAESYREKENQHDQFNITIKSINTDKFRIPTKRSCQAKIDTVVIQDVCMFS